MTAIASLGLLTGIVLAWGFRVWVLLPVTFATFLGTSIFLIFSGHSVLSAFGNGLIIGIVPQLGYFTGLASRYVVIALRTSRRSAGTAKRLGSLKY